MGTGILKTGTVLVNKIATGICDTISLSQTTKRFRNHYNKEGFFLKLFRGHINSVKNKIKGKLHDLWLVITKRTNGGYCRLLTRSPKESIVAVVKEAFTAYGFRWKIEEYHRHIKECYNLEDIQIKTFEGLQSMLAILIIAMSIIYSSLSSLHTRLLLESGVKTLNKERMYELCNFIYYKISTIIKVLLANMTPRAFLPQSDPSPNDGQLNLLLNFEN